MNRRRPRKMISKDDVRQLLRPRGITVAGFGPVPPDIETLELRERFPRAVVFGYTLSAGVLETIEDHPTLIYKHHYKTVNWLLDQTAFHLAALLEANGCRALAIPASQTVDWPDQKGHVSHKKLGRAAGIGWIGRSGLLIHPRLGARVRYASVLTDLDFEPDPAGPGDCGTCRKCIAVCPANAISETGVDLNKCRPKLVEFSRRPGIGQYICGVCVKACDGRH